MVGAQQHFNDGRESNREGARHDGKDGGRAEEKNVSEVCSAVLLIT